MKMEINCDQIEPKYELESPPDFITHLNYVTCLNMFSRDINISCNLSIRNIISESKLLKKKINLIELTVKSINGEYQAIQQIPDFAELCVSWISVKSYYLLFNLLLILEYLLSGQDSFLNFSHKGLLEKFKKRLDQKEISFNEKIFNTNFQCIYLMNLKVTSGANIRMSGFNLTERFVQILKKLVNYKLEDFKRQNKITNFRHKEDRQKKKEFLENNTVNICEFFYWYRIKANYRDLEFLNNNISINKFNEFYQDYFELTFAFFNAFKKLINNLAKTRLGKTIL